MQSRASLTAKFKTNESVMHKMISKILREKFGIKFFFDHTLGIVLAMKMLFQEIISLDRPIIVSECPAWTSYAEKMLDENIIRFMSKVKSPQQIMGKILKKHFSQATGIVSYCPL